MYYAETAWLVCHGCKQLRRSAVSIHAHILYMILLWSLCLLAHGPRMWPIPTCISKPALVCMQGGLHPRCASACCSSLPVVVFAHEDVCICMLRTLSFSCRTWPGTWLSLKPRVTQGSPPTTSGKLQAGSVPGWSRLLPSSHYTKAVLMLGQLQK